MLLDKEPFQHNRIIPWHDSRTACWIIIAFSSVIFLFSLIGIRVASTTPDYKDFFWLPIMLAVMSFYLIIRNSVRLIGQNRY